MKILGIEVEKKTDILAFTAFLMSVSNITIQVANIIKGPQIIMDNPKMVTIAPESYLEKSDLKNKNYMIITTNLNYFNKGSIGHHDIIRLEEAHIYFPNTDKNIKLNAHYYVQSYKEKDKLHIDIKSDAIPFQVQSGNVISHETAFISWPVFNKNITHNFLEYSEFITLLKTNAKIHIKFISINLKNKKKETNCQLITNRVLKSFEEKNWSSSVCIPE